MTPLHVAAQQGKTETIKVLLEANATLEAQATGEVTPLHMAAFRGHVEAVKALVKANATLEAQDVGQRTPLQLAVHQDHTETIKVLVEAEARRGRAREARLAHALRKAGRAPQGQFCSTSTPQSCFVRA